jgi:recombination protein RecR
MTPDAIKKLAALLSELPSLGPRQATRLAFHIAGMDRRKVEDLVETLEKIAKVKRCTRCFVLDELVNGLCSVCSNSRRNQALIAVVEKETDVHTLEKTKAFHGRYLVMSELSKDGVLEPVHKQRLQTLKHFIADLPEGKAQEIILALSPTTHGDVNATVLADQLKGLAGKITRLARGIPTGGEIEFADEDTLDAALKNRS